MTILTLDTASYPDGGAAVAASGGSLANSTTYYYRVAAVTTEGETCACTSFNGTTANPNLTLNLTWNAVPGVKSTAGYQIYRNTSDAWTSGSLKLSTSNTNSYSDTGSACTSGVPVTFSSNQITLPGEHMQSIAPQLPIVGKEDGSVQYLGSLPSTLPVEGFTIGTSAITDLGLLRDIRAGGVPVTVTISVFSQTWISATYLLASFTWSLDPGTADVAGGEYLRWTLELIRS